MNEAIELFHKGGLVMYALLIASVFTVTIAIERFSYYKKADSGNKFADEVSQLFRAGEISQAKELCKQTQGENANILSDVLNNGINDVDYIERYLESEAGISLAKFKKRIPYLGIVVTMAPLLGLLGTVVGMINSFNVFAAQSGQPHAITGGVGEALVATASGLCVAIIALICHSYFTQRIDTMLTNMERTFSSYVESLYRRQS